jgi:16S rRNA (adenine1518-N6/adenine1519-N6)-dimethyltransferase
VLHRQESTKIKLVANLPYSIATPLMINLLVGEVEFERLVFTVQQEVAARLVAAPGTRDYGWASVVVALSSEAKVVRTLPPSAFWPEPKIHSSLVVVKPRAGWKDEINVNTLSAFAAFAFQQRRKTVARILRDYLERKSIEADEAELLSQLNISPKTRGDQLTPEEFIRVSRALR